MPGRHHRSPGTRPTLRWLALPLGLLVFAAVVLGFTGTASASSTVKAQLTLSGLANGANPVGGSQIGIHPGDTVEITPSTAPTAGLDALGLGKLVDGLLATVAKFQVVADFSNLPGGHAKTVINSKSKPVTFSFPKVGTYNFTWSAQRISLLGAVPINLDGNQLAKAGVKLNAKNQYVGQIVVAKNPPKGGIGLQLPSIGVAPSLPVVGQLPTIGIPGIKVTVPVHVPNLNPSKSPGSGGQGSGGSKGGHSGASSPAGPSLVLPVPAMVVPVGGGDAVFGGGGFNVGALPGTITKLGAGSAPKAVSSAAPATSAASAKGQPLRSTGKHKTIDLAASKPSTGQLSVILAVIAIVALALVAGTYARLYLLRQSPKE